MSFEVVGLRRFRSGGYGNVYIGRRSDTNEFVVVKYLRESHIPHFRKAFQREVRLLARQVNGMIRILGWNLDTERPFYVMPYLKTGSVTQYAGRMTSDQLHAVASILAGTLASLHATGDYDPCIPRWLNQASAKDDFVRLEDREHPRQHAPDVPRPEQRRNREVYRRAAQQEHQQYQALAQGPVPKAPKAIPGGN